MVEVLLDRDAVAPGDDAAPHRRRLVVPDGLSAVELVEHVVATGYLPEVDGGATWSAASGAPLAVIAAAPPRVRPVAWRPLDPATLRARDGVVGLRFNYHGRQDPALVLEVLRRLRLDPFVP